MRCPKCGAEQPEAETCSQCQVVIEKYLKYLERQQSTPRPQNAGPAAPLQGASSPKRFPVAKVVMVLALLILVVLGFRYKAYKDGLKGTYSEISGMYTNAHYGFSVSVPATWKRFSVKEAIACKTIASEYADNYFLLSSPTEPAHSMIVVNISGITADHFASEPWESFVAETANRHRVVFNSIDTIEDFRVYRIGYMIGDAYREDNYFIANNELMLIYFYVVSPESSPVILEAMKQSIQTLKRI